MHQKVHFKTTRGEMFTDILINYSTWMFFLLSPCRGVSGSRELLIFSIVFLYCFSTCVSCLFSFSNILVPSQTFILYIGYIVFFSSFSSFSISVLHPSDVKPKGILRPPAVLKFTSQHHQKEMSQILPMCFLMFCIVVVFVFHSIQCMANNLSQCVHFCRYFRL